MDPFAAETRLRAVLRTYAARAMAGRDVWPALARELQLEPPRRQRVRLRPTLAPALAMGSLLALLLLVGGLGLISPHGLYPARAGTGTLTVATLPPWAPGPLVQARDGYTITIQPMSADLNRVVISYTITSPGQELRVLRSELGGGDSYTPVLRTHSGALLPWSGGLPYHRMRISAGAPTPTPGPVTNTALMMFDTEATDLSGPLQLDLTIPVGRVVQVVSNAQVIEPHSPITEVVAIVDLPDPRTPQVVPPAVSPFHFQFTMPLDTRRRVADVQQTIEQHGVRITLDRVVVTASEARITLHGDVPAAPTLRVPMSDMRLHIENEFAPSQANGNALVSISAHQNGDNGPWIYRYLGSLLTKNNDWAFYVQNVTTYDPTAGNSATDTPVPGLWTFHFTVPPLAAP